MTELPKGAAMSCEAFLDGLEELPVEAPGTGSAAQWLALLPEAARGHAANCASCEGTWQDFVETRRAMEAMKEGLPEPGPWFATRVMATIRAQEREIEERRNGVWISVRRLAPRLATIAAVVLVLAGTWALELRRTENARRQEMRPAEGLFEATPSAPVNDDIVASTYEERQP